MKAKLVKESLGFERGRDPRRALKIDKRSQIEQWLDSKEVTNYTINDDN